MNRWCGLKMMNKIMSFQVNDEALVSSLNWFCGALRHNTNKMAHYSDDLNGMGEYLKDQCRTSFFDMYNHVVRRLRKCKDEKMISFLLNCLKWRIGATDHEFILKSGIIQVLKDGNGQKDKAENPIKLR